MTQPTLPHNRLYTLVDSILVPHPAFERAVARIEQCFRTMVDAHDPVGIAIVGESRTGKSRSLEHFETTHPQHRTKESLITPFLRVTVPAKPTVKGLASTILYAMGDPLYDKGTEGNMEARILKLMKSAKTVVLALDEFQHFYDKATHRVQHHVADWLKVLVDRARIGLVVTGLPTCLAVIEQNEQLAGRFLAPTHLKRFNWLSDVDRNTFVAVLGAMQEVLQPFQFPDLTSDEMAFRMYCATGGLMGYLVKLMKQATANVLDASSLQIDLEALHQAYDDAIDARLTVAPGFNPFDRKFSAEPTPALVNVVQSIGTKAEEPPKPRRTKAPKQTAANALAA